MVKGVQFRIYPNKEQQNIIQQTFGCVRFVYNQGLAYRISEYEKGNSIAYKETSAMLTAMKHSGDFDFLKNADGVALQQSLRDLDKAYKNFFSKKASFPKYKSKHNHKKSYRTQNSHNAITVKESSVKLPKLGFVKAKISMTVDGKINNATIKQEPSGKYFVVLNVETDDFSLNNDGGVIGIDVGIKDFYIDSNGYKCSNPKYLSESSKKLAKEQKRLSRKKKGSSNRNKQRIKVARIQEHIANQRKDFLHKQSTKLVRENQIICLEDLNVKGMMKNHKLAKNIADVSWYTFFNMLEYKSQKYNTEIIKVPRFFASSQTCSCCGSKFPITKDLSVRNWECPNCHTILDRDVNAAINILNKGLEIRYQ